MKIKLCLGSACYARGNGKILKFLEERAEEPNPGFELDLSACLCQENCANGPNIQVDGLVLEGMSLEKMKRLLDERRGS